MSRLIDADKLIQEMRKWYWDKEKQKAAENDVSPMDLFTHLAITTVQEQPTAFDVDKVVEQIESIKEKEYRACTDEQCGFCDYFNDCWDGEMCDKLALDKAIEIVKGGGVE